MSPSSSGHKGRRSDLAVPDTDTKSLRDLYIGTRFSAIRSYAGRVPELSLCLPWDSCGGSSSYSSQERACARDHYPLRWRCAGSRPPTTRSAVLPLSCVSIPSIKSSPSFITSGATKTNGMWKRCHITVFVIVLHGPQESWTLLVAVGEVLAKDAEPDPHPIHNFDLFSQNQGL